jgi:hypothetical protein
MFILRSVAKPDYAYSSPNRVGIGRSFFLILAVSCAVCAIVHLVRLLISFVHHIFLCFNCQVALTVPFVLR